MKFVPKLLIGISVFLVLLDQCYYYLVCPSIYQIMFLIPFLFVSYILLQKAKEECESKNIISWKNDLMDASINSINSNYTILDKDLKIVYTNENGLEDFIESKRLKLLWYHKFSEVFDYENLDKIIEMENKCYESMKNKKQEHFIININNKQILVQIFPMYDVKTNIIGLTLIMSEFIEKSSIYNI